MSFAVCLAGHSTCLIEHLKQIRFQTVNTWLDFSEYLRHSCCLQVSSGLLWWSLYLPCATVFWSKICFLGRGSWTGFQLQNRKKIHPMPCFKGIGVSQKGKKNSWNTCFKALAFFFVPFVDYLQRHTIHKEIFCISKDENLLLESSS